MTIEFYNMKCEVNRVDKTPYLTLLTTLNGEMREGINFENPSFNVYLSPDISPVNVVDSDSTQVIDNDYIDVQIRRQTAKILSANYVKIVEFNRYYFITNRAIVCNNIWRVDLQTDLLYTFNSSIRQLTGFVTRNENEYNEYIVDDRLPVEFIGDVSETWLIPYREFIAGQEHSVVITVYNEDISKPTGTVSTDSFVLSTVSRDLLPALFQTKTYIVTLNSFISIQKFIAEHASLASGIVSVNVYPFDLPVEGLLSPVSILGQTITGVTGYTNVADSNSLIFSTLRFTIPAHFNNFLDYVPYTKYEFYVPYLGWMELNPEIVLNKELLLSYALNIQDGSSQVFITDESADSTPNGKLVYGGSCHLGVSIPINTTNAESLADERLKTNTNLILGSMTSTMGIVGGMLTANPVMFAGGVAGLVGSVASNVTALSTMHETAQCSISGGELGLYAPQRPRLRITRPKPIITDYTEYLRLNGKPLNATRLLDDVTGYTEITNVYVENIGSATKPEIDEIERLLKGGIIL